MLINLVTSRVIPESKVTKSDSGKVDAKMDRCHCHMPARKHFKTFKIRLKLLRLSRFLFQVNFYLVFLIAHASGNRPPRFLTNGQPEIVLRLKEGGETPVGTLIYRIQGEDPDNDLLHFAVRHSIDSDIIHIKNTAPNQANVYLAKELDRETRDEYQLVLTLTDGKLGEGNYITQSLLILVEDVNDNAPTFLPYPSTVTIRENSVPGVVTVLEAKDEDEGAYGQVLYHLQELEGDEGTFSIATVNGQAFLRLQRNLDYEKKPLYQLRVLAVDRAKIGRTNTGTAALLVRVEDVEDQPPEFISVTPVARIAEDAPVGTSILQVKAVDGDRGVNNKIAYSIENTEITPQGSELFRIDPKTGVIYTNRILDREEGVRDGNPGGYIVKIRAVEVGSKIKPDPFATTEVTIILTDINDETPTFRSSRYICEVDENAQVNTPLTFMGGAVPEVFDYDQGKNGTFELYTKGDGGIFEITPSKGVNEASFLIRVKNSTAIDYEQMKTINFSIVAREIVRTNAKSSEVSVMVYVRDRNDNFPEFNNLLYEVSVLENCPAGTTIARIQATDSDSGNFGTNGIRYTNLGGGIANLLSIHPVTGIVTVKTAGGPSWDREVVSRHFLTVEARDNLGQGNRNTAQLIINIEDVNDNPPIFLRNRYEATLFENELSFELPLKIEAKDLDLNGTKNSQIMYYITDGSLKNNFTISKLTGVINPNGPLDFELLPDTTMDTTKVLHFTVQARDSGSPALWSEVPLVVYLKDENDHAPVFEQLFYNRTIAEDTPSGTSVLQVKAFDSDGSFPNNQVVYRIQSGALDKFIINADTGIISVANGAVLDPDLTEPRANKFTMTVLALDGGIGDQQLQTSVFVNITIKDINNKPPIFYDPGTVRLKENTPVGSIITQLHAEDLDSSPVLRFHIDSAISEARTEEGTLLKPTDFSFSDVFDLDGNTGVLKVVKLIDREKVDLIRLGVVVEDIAAIGAPQRVAATVTIIIDDENDNNPRFRHPFYKRSVTENSPNGVVVGNVVADDADKNKTISYALEGPAAVKSLLHLDADTGEIVVANRIDHEMFPWLNLTVRATDNGVPSRSSLVELFVKVLDENDNNPYFVTNITNLTIYEDAPIGTEVIILHAKDADSGDYGTITYLLDRMSSQGKFSLDPHTGSLRVAESLDRENVNMYLLVAEAWDNYQFGYTTGESRNVFKQIPIKILDVNDNKPELILPSDDITITEFHEVGMSVALIKGTDADDNATPNGQLKFSIIDGNELGLFQLHQIDYWTAYLLTTTNLQNKYGNYSLMIEARDYGSPQLFVQEFLNVTVTDFNDHAPVFITPAHNTTLRVLENTTAGSPLLEVQAFDNDTGVNGAVRYRLKNDPAGHYRTFAIGFESGVLELRKPLDRKVQKIYDIRIEAFDLGVPTTLSSDLDLTIFVSNSDNYEPKFAMDRYLVNFTENEPPGMKAYVLPDTIDKDEIDLFENSNLPICYYIISGNEQRLFSLERTTHELITTSKLDREKNNTHFLTVKASTDCINTPNQTNRTIDANDDTILEVVVFVNDINDNPPRFVSRVFTGGVTTNTDFGTKFMQVKATDADDGVNAQLRYFQIGRIQMTLTEGLDNIQRPQFLVDHKTGEIQLNFDPQQDMKGHFDFMVLVNDTGGLQDMARVFIYLLREDQRVRFVLRQHPPDIRHRIESFRDVLGNVTGAIVNVDEFKIHANHDGTVDKTRTDLYLHLVNKKDNSILEVSDVLKLVDQNIEALDTLFKDFNVLDTQPASITTALPLYEPKTTLWLGASTLFLSVLLLVCLTLCFLQRQVYHRKLKAASTSIYDSQFDLGVRGFGNRVPNTNKHSVEGSNPIWLQAYENEWYKQDELSQASDRDSLDENALTSEGETITSSQVNDLCSMSPPQQRNQNVYQSLPKANGNVPNVVNGKKEETTEL